ncbi:MAG: helix-turn-helix domain-containing protein [Spirochaetes bacterium]|nr:helix-turn-helix domain-containing protein [Spirochaetota bacterium]
MKESNRLPPIVTEINTIEAAAMIGVSARTLRLMCLRATPEIPFVKYGTMVRFRVCEIEDYLSRQNEGRLCGKASA